MTRLLGVEAYALRYWEQEFPSLRERRDRSGRRFYTDADLAELRRIKELLYEERYTIPGARQRLAAEGAAPEAGDAGREASMEPPGPPALSAASRVRVRAIADKGGSAALRLEAALASARRVEATLDRLTEGERS